MVKRRLVIGLAAVAAACGGAASLTTPTSSVGSAGRVSALGTTASSIPTPCPSNGTRPSPSVAIFGVNSHVSSCGTLDAVFKVTPDPPVGGTPLQVTFNMCKSSDTDPLITLHFQVVYGDGEHDSGECRLTHSYIGLGQYTATACVSDGDPRRGDGVCQSYTVGVGDACDATFFNPRGFPNGRACTIAVDARTQGNTACGQPLAANLGVSTGTTSGAQAFCPPGHLCTLKFPVPFESSFPFATVTAANAKATPLSFNISGCSVVIGGG
jgi:hypothetical protein